MVAVGAWDRNDLLLPGEGDLTEQEARKLAVMALKDAYSIELPFIAEKYGSDALEKLGDYQVGYLFQRLENDEYNLTQLMWDIMLTTDPEYLSDGYRVQFQRVIDHETGEENIVDVLVEHANLGSG